MGLLFQYGAPWISSAPLGLISLLGSRDKRRNEAEDKIHCLQNILPFAFSVARHSHKPFIANHFSWSTIRVMNVLNGVNLFCRRIVVMTCMLKLVPRGLQTKIKRQTHWDMKGICSK